VSARDLLTIPELSEEHSGGMVQFGPDGGLTPASSAGPASRVRRVYAVSYRGDVYRLDPARR
jgi:hypothetical protein